MRETLLYNQLTVSHLNAKRNVCFIRKKNLHALCAANPSKLWPKLPRKTCGSKRSRSRQHFGNWVPTSTYHL